MEELLTTAKQELIADRDALKKILELSEQFTNVTEKFVAEGSCKDLHDSLKKIEGHIEQECPTFKVQESLWKKLKDAFLEMQTAIREQSIQEARQIQLDTAGAGNVEEVFCEVGQKIKASRGISVPEKKAVIDEVADLSKRFGETKRNFVEDGSLVDLNKGVKDIQKHLVNGCPNLRNQEGLWQKLKNAFSKFIEKLISPMRSISEGFHKLKQKFNSVKEGEAGIEENKEVKKQDTNDEERPRPLPKAFT